MSVTVRLPSVVLAFLNRLALAGALAVLPVADAGASEPLRLNVVGGLANVTQYTEHEQPFWSERIAQVSGGRLSASIRPFDQSGIRGQELLRLLELGVVTYGTVLVSLAAESEPELGAIDLPTLNPDVAALRRTTAAFRPHMQRILRERYGVELLAVYIYPAQVVYCTQPFARLDALAGRRVRTSAVAQSEMMQSLGAVPVITPFAEVVSAITTGVVDCAVTGTLSGNEIGLSRVTTHLHEMAISWGVSLFLANSSAWAELPDDLQQLLRNELAGLEMRIWQAAVADTTRGIACNVGAPSCVNGRRDRMTLVPMSPSDAEMRQRILIDTVLPRWIDRCGPECVDTWNRTIAPIVGVEALSPQVEETARRP